MGAKVNDTWRSSVQGLSQSLKMAIVPESLSHALIARFQLIVIHLRDEVDSAFEFSYKIDRLDAATPICILNLTVGPGPGKSHVIARY